MVIKVYVSTISFSQEVKKNQQRALMILESKNIPFVSIDITDPGQEDAKDYMNENAKPKGNNKVPMTPQIFNEADYCGDFDALDMANECDTLGDFLKLTDDEKKEIKIGITSLVPDDEKSKGSQPLTNGVSTSRENSQEKQPAVEEESKEVEETPLEEVNEVPPMSVPTPAETPIEDDEQTRDLQDQLESKGIDGEVEIEKINEEVNEDMATTAAESVEDEKGVEETEEGEEKEVEEAEDKEDQIVQDTSA